MFISIVIGLGIDYGIYVLFRYDEEIARGRSVAEALDITASRTGPGVLLGALTAAGTFYSLMLTDFHGVQELGFIAGTSLLAAFLGMLTVLPAILVLMGRHWTRDGRPDHRRGGGAVRDGDARLDRLTRRHTAVLVAAAMITVVSLWSARTIGFDYNLLNLQASGTESVVWEEQIIAAQARSSFSALSTATSLFELAQKRDAFARLPSVAEIDSALLFIPDQQAAKLPIIRDAALIVRPLRMGVSPSLDVPRLAAALDALGRRLDLAIAEAGAAAADSKLPAVRAQVTDLLDGLRTADHRPLAQALTRYQTHLVSEFRDMLLLLQQNVEAREVTPEDVPTELRRKFVSDGGRFLLQIHPRVNVWDRDGATRFVEELRSVDAEVTGAPVVAYESIQGMERAYRQGTVYALALVALISAVMLRRPRETVIALIPLALGTVWAAGLLSLFDFKLNLANVWGAPLIIGASAEYGLNIVARVMEAREHGGPVFPRSTTSAVALNGLTTIAGFGSLLVAHHRGIWSLGLLLTVGSLTSLIAALVVLPLLVGLFDRAAVGIDRAGDPACDSSL
jgi:hypothetical protein